MKECSLDHFTESLRPWLDNDYIRSISVDEKGRITFFFMDGVEDTYHITDCDMSHIKQVCKELAERGIPVKERK